MRIGSGLRHRSLLVLALVGAPQVAWAGMPHISLTRIASLRLEALSFFLILFIGLTFVVQRLWNFLAADFPKMPTLTFKKALALVFVWGLAFHLVLTMISGARELMTPGAWERQGSLYQLRGKKSLHEIRKERLTRLKHELWRHAAEHQGAFPANRFDANLPEDVWRLSFDSKSTYVYLPGRTPGQGREVLAYEPELFGPLRYVLRTDGSIAPITIDILVREIDQ